MTIYATAGAKFYIGTAFTGDILGGDLIESAFTSVTWTQIKGLEGLGSLGDTVQEISLAVIDNQREFRAKGTRNAGTMEIVAAVDADDPGQLALIAAEKSNSNYHFKLVLNDAPDGGTPSERKFIALVMKAAEQFDQANNVVKLNASLAVNSNIVRKAAAAGGGG